MNNFRKNSFKNRLIRITSFKKRAFANKSFNLSKIFQG
ncbi:hypothetical protein RIEPE_0179 [Candidatus Riesia pediculicola USDA]|uniref:Uncharacterized protein n=1 Tax=Riesia pediculicola (strain USDA) TaxID=515618 RepID=D4G7Y7_RIEPU|nr:hypothetical protein RIEPE_0179 [Candidatus Riesia pediculicola USDA]